MHITGTRVPKSRLLQPFRAVLVVSFLLLGRNASSRQLRTKQRVFPFGSGGIWKRFPIFAFLIELCALTERHRGFLNRSLAHLQTGALRGSSTSVSVLLFECDQRKRRGCDSTRTRVHESGTRRATFEGQIGAMLL